VSKQPQKEPTFIEGLIGSAVPIAIALAIGILGTALVYMFWFGADSIMGWLF
jgi:hypothetical protein